MKTTKDTRNIPVRREWLAELMSLLTPEERFVTKNGHLCLWTLPAKQLVFVVEEPCPVVFRWLGDRFTAAEVSCPAELKVESFGILDG